MKNFLFVLLAFMFTLPSVTAQDVDTDIDTEVDLKAKSNDNDCDCGKGSITAAVMFGQGQFLNHPGVSSTTFTSGQIPTTTTAINDNSSNNIIGMELRYFVTDDIALKLSGGSVLTSTPLVRNIEPIGDPDLGGIPTYGDVDYRSNTDINLNLGFEYHLGTANPNLFFWVGGNGAFYYAQNVFEDGFYRINTFTGLPDFNSLGESSTNTYGWAAQATTGLEYYLAKGFYIGVETRPVSFTYAYSDAKSRPDLPALTAQSYNWAIFAQTFIKLGFKLK